MEPLNLAESTTAIIRERRSIYPPTYTDEPVADHIIAELLENANYAPTHRLTEPWRFKVIAGAKRAELGSLLANFYQSNTPPEQFSERKHRTLSDKARLSSHIIAICMQRDAEERVPEWEEIASTAMAVQNMWLTATAHHVGAYWSSHPAIYSEECRRFLNLQEGERCLGFFFLGHHKMPHIEPRRTPIANKVTWL